jgi:hypothetical protein
MADQGTTVISTAEGQQSAPPAAALSDFNPGKYPWGQRSAAIGLGALVLRIVRRI